MEFPTGIQVLVILPRPLSELLFLSFCQSVADQGSQKEGNVAAQ